MLEFLKAIPAPIGLTILTIASALLIWLLTRKTK